MIKTNIKLNMHLERQTLLEVHIFIGIYFEEEADGLMEERWAKLVIAIAAVVIVALVVLMKKRKAEI